MTHFMRDLRYALRGLLRAPGFAAVAVLSLAFGIGPNTAVFSLVNALLLRDSGVAQPERLVDIYELTAGGDFYYTSYRNWEIVRDGTTDVFDGVAAYALFAGAVELGGEPAPVAGELVTGNYFDVLGVRPVVGRGFLPEEDATPGTHPVMVVSHRFWTTRMDRSAVPGSQVRLNGRPYEVVGVAPPEFRGKVIPGVSADVFMPIMTYPHLNPGQMGSGDLAFSGRLRAGVPVERALAVVDALAARVDEERRAVTGSVERFRLAGVPFDQVMIHPGLDRAVGGMAALLLAVVGLILLVACTNLAGFLLARGADRRREMAIRLAMGAHGGTLVRQLLVESLLLASLGGLAGLLLGWGVLKVILGVELPLPVPLNLDAGMDLRVLAFTAVMSLLAGVIFGLTPALRASRAPVAATLRDESGGVVGARGRWQGRGILVAAQMGLSMVLLIGAGLFLRSLQEAVRIDPGFSTGPAGIVHVQDQLGAYPSAADRADLAEEVRRRAGSSPGIDRVAVTSRLPLALGVRNRALEVPGVPAPPGADHHRLEFASVSPDYFRTMEIPLREGREFLASDDQDALPVVIVSAAAADRFWPGERAEGRTVRDPFDGSREWTVVGVAADVKIWSLGEAPRAYLYFPFAQDPTGQFSWVARGPAPAPELAAAIRGVVRDVDPDLFVASVGTMDAHLGYILFLPRMAALLLTAAGVLGLGLACTGLYGVVSYGVARRVREMGIRMALGANQGSVVGLVMRGGLRLVLVGGAAGIVLALLLGRVIAGFLVGVAPLDLVTIVSVPLLLGSVAALAAWLPARRASRILPMAALRSE